MAVLTVQNGVGTLPSSGEDVVINVLRTGDKGEKGQSGGSGGASVNIGTTAPTSGVSTGDLWYDSDEGDLYVYYNDGNSSQWVSATSPQATKGQKGDTGSGSGPTGPTGTTGPTGQQKAQ